MTIGDDGDDKNRSGSGVKIIVTIVIIVTNGVPERVNAFSGTGGAAE